MLGLDCSDNNRGYNWPALALSVDFALVKATEGTDYVSKTLHEQGAGAAGAGLEVGYYHYLTPGDVSPAEQARFFISTLGELAGDGNPLALDLEEGEGDQTDRVLEFAHAVRIMAGRYPALYTSPAFADRHLRKTALDLLSLPLWVASWGTPSVRVPDPWPRAAIWQQSDRWQVPGAPAGALRDEFLAGGRQAFRDMGVTIAMADLAYVKRFLTETAVTLEGWREEVKLNQWPDARRLEVAEQMGTRAGEARELASS